MSGPLPVREAGTATSRDGRLVSVGPAGRLGGCPSSLGGVSGRNTKPQGPRPKMVSSLRERFWWCEMGTTAGSGFVGVPLRPREGGDGERLALGRPEEDCGGPGMGSGNVEVVRR